MTLTTMHWWQRLDSLMQAEQEGVIQPGMAADLASAPWKSADPSMMNALVEAQNQQWAQAQAKQEERGLFQKILPFTSGGLALLEFGDPLFKVLGAPYKWLSTEVLSPITHYGLVAANKDWQRQIGAESKWEAVFDLDTWHKASEWAEEDSWGRGFAMNLMAIKEIITGEREVGEGITDEDIGDWQYTLNTTRAGQLTSGLTDFFGVLFLDPLIIGGKFVKSAGLLRTVTPASKAIQKEQDFDKILAREPVRRFLTWTEGKSATEIAQHSALKDNPQAGLIADLLSKASRDDKNLIYKIGLGDQAAMDELTRRAPHIAAQIARMRQLHDYNLQNLLPQAGLGRTEIKALEDDLKLRQQAMRDKHATLLRLAETENIPLGTPAVADPFAAQYYYKNGLAETRASHALAYSRVAATDASKRLFSTPEPLRTPAHLQAAMDELDELENTARLLTDARASAQSPAARRGAPIGGARLGEDLQHAPAERQLGSATLYSSDELAGLKPLSGRTRGGRQLALRFPSETFPDDPLRMATKGEMRALASRPAPEASRLMHEAMVESLPASRYPLANFDPAEVSTIAQQAEGQLSYLDEVIQPEIARLDEEVGWYRRISERADDMETLTPTSGIFRSIDVIPRGGAYSRLAERGARKRHERATAYSRGFGFTRYNPENNQIRFLGPLARPIHYVKQIPRVAPAAIQGGKAAAALTRVNTPAIYDPNDVEAWRTMDTWLRRVKGLPGEVRMRWVNEHMGLTNEADKLEHVQRVEAAVMEHMMRRQGIDNTASIEKVVAMTLGQRRALVGRMAAQAADHQPGTHGSATGVYGAAQSGLRVGALERDGTATVVSPVLKSQLLNKHPLLPIDDLETAFYRDRHILRGHPNLWGAHDTILESLQISSRVWKGLTLARVGYVARTISDESLMAMATIGGMQYLSGVFPGTARLFGNLPSALANLPARYARRRAVRRGELPEGTETLRRRPHGRGEGIVDVGGIAARGMFHGPRGPIYRSLTSTEQQGLWEVQQQGLTTLRAMSTWKILDPAVVDEETHLVGWMNALNHQFGKDKLARLALSGATPEQMARWLKSAEGQKYSAGNKLMRAKTKEWAHAVHALVDQYVVGVPDIAQAALRGNVNPGLLKQIPIDLRPTVHGGNIDYNLGLRGFSEWTNTLLDGFYKFANKLPTDALVRHPVADVLYQRRLRELVAVSRAQGIDPAVRPEQLYHMEEVARQWTVKRLNVIFKDHLFDNPATALRFIFPFYGAWRASLARWGRAVGENPALIGYANQGWQGLHKPFDVVDENGMPVEDKDRESIGFDTKHSILVRMPEWMVKRLDIPYAPARRIPLRSMNTVLQGDPWYNPGAGPFVTIPIARLVDSNPGAAKLARDLGILPFGARSTKELLLPKAIRAQMAEESGLDDRSVANTFINIARVEMTRWQMGQRADMPTSREIWSKTNTLTRLRKWSDILSPVANQPVYYDKQWETGKAEARRPKLDADGNPILDDNGNPVMETYTREVPKEFMFLAGKFRDYMSKDPEHGEEKFLAEFPEAFAYVESVSRNPAGIPANPQSWAKSQRMKHLYGVAPDIFSSVVGIRKADRKGFDPDIYDAQFREMFDPVSRTHMREPREPESFMREAMAAKGWRDYDQLQQAITTVMVQRGMENLDGPEGRVIEEARAAVIEAMQQQNPFWYAEYSGGTDPQRMERIIQQAEVISQDKRLLSDPGRPDIAYLHYYLELRNLLKQELMRRGRIEGGSADLRASSNRDLKSAWDAVKTQMNRDNTLWEELWGNKYFARDDIRELVR